MNNWSWEQLDSTVKAFFGLLATVGLFLGGGKLLRINRVDKAATDNVVAAEETSTAVNQFVTTQIEKLSVAVAEQSKKIEELTTKVTQLESEVHRLNNGRQTALKLLNKIHLCSDCEAKYSVLLETAISSLEDTIA